MENITCEKGISFQPYCCTSRGARDRRAGDQHPAAAAVPAVLATPGALQYNMVSLKKLNYFIDIHRSRQYQ
jgi:hypothetical protein